MKFNVSEGEKYQKVMEVEIPVAETELPIKFACKRLSQKANIPGFRPGKAPRTVLENYLGMPAIMEEALDELLPKAYAQGLVETKIVPCAQPQVEVVSMEANQPILLKFTITEMPEVKLGQYKGLEVTRKIIEVADEDIDRDLEGQRARLSRTEDAEADAAAENGNVVVIDFKGFKDGVAFEGGEGQEYPLELGSNSFIPGFEEQLIGAKSGDEKKIEVTFPEQYQEPSLAGQAVTFEVKVHKVQRKLLPELDQSFVEEVSETAENMEQLREEVRKRLSEQSLSMADSNTRNEAVMTAVNNAEVDVPPVMIATELEHQIEEAKNRMAQQGITLEQYLEYTGGSEEDFTENYRSRAANVVKRDLVMEAIVKAEDIPVSEEEVEEQIQQLSVHYWQPVEEIKKAFADNERLEELKFSIKMGKAADMIYKEAVITDEVMDREQLKAKYEAMQEAYVAGKAGQESDESVDNDAAEAQPVEAEVKDAE